MQALVIGVTNLATDLFHQGADQLALLGIFMLRKHLFHQLQSRQWRDVGEKWEVLEYIMLDEEQKTAVFVYTMSERDLIEENSAYDITPSEMHFLTEDFSIYEDFKTAPTIFRFLNI